MHVVVQGEGMGIAQRCVYIGVVLLCPYMMNASEMGKKGIAVVNANYTTEKRKKAAKKGWKTRKAKAKQ